MNCIYVRRYTSEDPLDMSWRRFVASISTINEMLRLERGAPSPKSGSFEQMKSAGL